MTLVGDLGDLNLTSLPKVNLAFEEDLLMQLDEGSLWRDVTASDACDSILFIYMLYF